MRRARRDRGHRDMLWRATDGWLVKTRAEHTAESLEII